MVVISNGKLPDLFFLKPKSITFELEPQILILMKTTILMVLCTFFSFSNSYSQEINFYKNAKGDTHICGEFPLDYLEHDSTYSVWFNKYYNELKLPNKRLRLKSKLKNSTVDIYLGTWCGDSKKWVPKFIKLWDELGLNRTQLKFIALYGSVEGKYKQGPNGEEKNKDIHRVPTFIFKRSNKEIARIVESPNNNLETDLAQIALGYPSNPNYRGATSMINLLKSNSVDSVKTNIEYLNEVYRLVKSTSELNTLGYVYLESDRIDEALTIFYYNTRFFK